MTPREERRLRKRIENKRKRMIAVDKLAAEARFWMGKIKTASLGGMRLRRARSIVSS
jgi:hypothetical protein